MATHYAMMPRDLYLKSVMSFLFQNTVQAKQNLEMTPGYQWKETGGGKSFMSSLAAVPEETACYVCSERK